MEGYRAQVLGQVDMELERIREENAEKLAAAKQEVYVKLPRVKVIDMEVQRAGLEAAQKVRSGQDAKSVTSQLKKALADLRREKKELLKSANFPQNYLDERFTCKKCSDKGVVDNTYCECRKELVRRITYKLSGLDEVKLNEFDKFKIEYYGEDIKERGVSARRNAMHILETGINFEKGNLLFYGRAGLGKTFVSSCIAKKHMQAGKLVCYMSAPQMFGMLDDHKFGRDTSAKTKQRIDMIYQADLLIIDDLGTEFRTALTDTHLFDIINSRLMRSASVIINTNLNMGEIKDVYSERISSRLAGEYKLLKFFGEDIRLRKRRGAN